MDEAGRSYFPLSSHLGRTRVGDVDDWSGVSDGRQRRRIQNRRNQRARSEEELLPSDPIHDWKMKSRLTTRQERRSVEYAARLTMTTHLLTRSLCQRGPIRCGYLATLASSSRCILRCMDPKPP